LNNAPALGWFGGEGNGWFANSTKGWTWEASFKIFNTPRTVFEPVSKNITGNGQDWAKLFDFGDGNKGTNQDQCENDIIYGFNGGDNYMKFQSCNTVARDQSLGDNSATRRIMKVNTWYHLVVTMQLTANGAQGSLWLDGQLIESKNMPSYPLYASRANARIGDSSWNADPFFNGALDMLTIYSQAVNQQQVSAMYAAANRVATSSSSAAPSVSSSSTGAAQSSVTLPIASTQQPSTATPRSSSSSVIPSQSSATGANTQTPTGTVQSSTGVVQSSTGVVSSSAAVFSSSVSVPTWPANSVRVSMNAVLPQAVTPSNYATIKNQLEADIIQNLANATNVPASSFNGLVQVQSIGGVSSTSRRLLQTETPVVFVILGTISNVVTNLGVDAAQVANAVATTLSDRVANGQFTTANSGATVPRDQNVEVVSTDDNDGVNGAVSFTQSFALTVLCAVIAMMAL